MNDKSPELEWWGKFEPCFKWHTWDRYGKTAWVVRPVWNGYHWHYWPREDDTVPDSRSYDFTPCPIEIDPSKTLRKRPKESL